MLYVIAIKYTCTGDTVPCTAKILSEKDRFIVSDDAMMHTKNTHFQPFMPSMMPDTHEFYYATLITIYTLADFFFNGDGRKIHTHDEAAIYRDG